MLSPGVIIPFDGNHADIPAGFERDTRFDGKFPKGVATGHGDTGGSNEHTHTVTHTHKMSVHYHRVYFNNPWDGGTHDAGPSGSVTGADHSHNGEPGTPYVGTEASGSTAASLASATGNSLPPYYEVIFIKSTGYKAIPVNGMVFCNGDRAGMDYHTASQNKYLRGAGTGANAGGTGGGTSHSHTQSHTHTANNHTHPNAFVGTYTYPEGGSTNGGTNDDSEDGASSPALAHGGHNHTVTVYGAAQPMNSNTDNSSTASNVEPVYKTLKHYKASAQVLPIPGDIAITTESTAPLGWIECDGENDTPDLHDYFIKNTTSAGATGGANTHTHTLAHTHTGNGTHTHTYDEFSGYSGSSGGHTGSGERGRESHKHQINANNNGGVSSVTGNYATNTSTTSSDDSNEPAYIKVMYIQFKFNPLGGGIMLL